MPKRSFRKATVSRALERSRERGEVADVEEHHRDLALLALDQLAALLEHALRHVGVDVGAERLAQRLALGEPLHHLVEAPRELAHLVAGGDRDARVEVAAASPRSVAFSRSSTGCETERVTSTVSSSEIVKATSTATTTSSPRSLSCARSVGGQPAHHHARDHVDQRQRAEQLPAQRHARGATAEVGRQLLGDVLHDRAQEQLVGEEVQDGGVGDRHGGAGEDDQRAVRLRGRPRAWRRSETGTPIRRNGCQPTLSVSSRGTSTAARQASSALAAGPPSSR